jgi:hydrogenase/urease accessory protein HupE
MKTIKTQAVVGTDFTSTAGTATVFIATVFYSAASLGHSGAELTALAPGGLLAGLMHPLTGIDHILALITLGGAMALLLSGENRAIKRGLSGAVLLGMLLSWSFVHYSGEYFASYALGFASTSALLMIIGISIASVGSRYKQGASIRIRHKNHSITQKRADK